MTSLFGSGMSKLRKATIGKFGTLGKDKTLRKRANTTVGGDDDENLKNFFGTSLATGLLNTRLIKFSKNYETYDVGRCEICLKKPLETFCDIPICSQDCKNLLRKRLGLGVHVVHGRCIVCRKEAKFISKKRRVPICSKQCKQMNIKGGFDEKGDASLLDVKIPNVIVETVDYLTDNGAIDTHGIFRISGRVDSMNEIKEEYESLRDGIEYQNIHDCSGILKLYLRSLTTPLIPSIYYDKCMEIEKAYAVDTNSSQDVVQKKVQKYVQLLSKFPEVHYRTFVYLFKLLNKISKNSTVNAMSPHNLAIVFAPTTLIPAEINYDTLKQNAVQIDCIKFLIKHFHEICSEDLYKKNRRETFLAIQKMDEKKKEKEDEKKKVRSTEPIFVFKVGDKVRCKDQWGKVCTALVTKVEEGKSFIEYEGEAMELYNEWVPTISGRLLPVVEVPYPTQEQIKNREFSIGSKLSCKDQWGASAPAVILKIEGGRFFIHYDGQQSMYDEWVEGLDRFGTLNMKETNTTSKSSNADETLVKTQKMDKATIKMEQKKKLAAEKLIEYPMPTKEQVEKGELKVGDKIKCRDQWNKWCDALILKLGDGKVFIHYIGESPVYDEKVESSRIMSCQDEFVEKIKKVEKGEMEVKDIVQCKDQWGTLCSVSIVKREPEGDGFKYFIHYIGQQKMYDEWVTDMSRFQAVQKNNAIGVLFEDDGEEDKFDTLKPAQVQKLMEKQNRKGSCFDDELPLKIKKVEPKVVEEPKIVEEPKVEETQVEEPKVEETKVEEAKPDEEPKVEEKVEDFGEIPSVCDECEESEELKVYCKNCETFMCNDCNTSIHKKGARKKHIRVKLPETPKLQEQCDECEETVLVTVYCKNCETFMCADCNESIHKKGARKRHERQDAMERLLAEMQEK